MALPQEQAPFRVIPLDEFLQFGQFIHNALDKRQLQGVDEHGTSVRFGLAREMGEISTDPLVTPPYGNVMDLRTFVINLGKGIAAHRKQALSPTFDLEVNVAVPAVLIPRLESSADSKMIEAMNNFERARRLQLPPMTLPSLMAESLGAVEAGSMLRDVKFNIELQYANYASAAEYFLRYGSFDGYSNEDDPDESDNEPDELLNSGGREE